MPYSEFLCDRINRFLEDKQLSFLQKKMMGGMCFMVDDKMFCGTHFDKKKECDLLMLRIGQAQAQIHVDNEVCVPMDFTGKRMKDFVYVLPNGYDLENDLDKWLELCLDFNPLAKSSKKK